MSRWWSPRGPPAAPIFREKVERIFHKLTISAATTLTHEDIPRPNISDPLAIVSISIRMSQNEYWNSVYIGMPFPSESSPNRKTLVPFTICHFQRGFTWRPPNPEDWNIEAPTIRVSMRTNSGVANMCMIIVEWMKT